MTASTTPLTHCPFCGAEARVRRFKDGFGQHRWYVHCTRVRYGREKWYVHAANPPNNYCHGYAIAEGDTKAEAMERWNRRPAAIGLIDGRPGCPFCNGPAVVQREMRGRTHRAFCERRCHGAAHAIAATEAETIERWSRRVP